MEKNKRNKRGISSKKKGYVVLDAGINEAEWLINDSNDIRFQTLGLTEDKPIEIPLALDIRTGVLDRKETIQGPVIYTDDLNDQAVTTEKIADYAVDETKIKDQSVGNIALMDYAVDQSKLADYSVTSQK